MSNTASPSLVMLAAVVGVALTAYPAAALGSKDTPAKPTPTIVIQDKGGFASAISEVAQAVTPAVVHIEITGTTTQPANPFPFPFPFPFGGVPQGQTKVPVHALGSGVVISDQGYIITNNHVVENANTIEVQFHDGSTQKAKLIGRDPATDLAVIKVQPFEGMSYAHWGDSDSLKIGDWVVAIGSPRGLDWTVTAGIVSAKHRAQIGALGPTGYEDFIQTDAAINPGNSGGPLIDLKGEVIGINSLIISTSQGSEGLGFAIPSNMAKSIAQSLIENGKVVRGYLGVAVQDLTGEMGKSLKLPEGTKGAIVAQVAPGGPADHAGVEQGDVIVGIGDHSVQDAAELRAIVASTKPGTDTTLALLRDGKTMSLPVKIGDLSHQGQAASAGGAAEVLGLTVEKVTGSMASKLHLRRAMGVVITDVASGSPAQQAGLEPGDVIFQVGGQQVNDAGRLAALIDSAKKQGDDRVLMLVRDNRSGQVGYLMVPLSGGSG